MTHAHGQRAHLALADGTAFEGALFGAPTVAVGEAVFTTAMMGYEEILTDPSFTGQLVVMTTPEIGNYGIAGDDAESLDGRPQVAGFVTRSLSPIASSHRAREPLGEWLARHGVAAITEIDTRKLTRHLRDHGSQNAAFGAAPVDELVARARAAPDMAGLDLVARVSPKARTSFAEGRGAWVPAGAKVRPAERHVVVVDYGSKKNILRCLVDAGCRLTVVPARTTAKEILDLSPDGVFLSNGPGDPAAVTYAVETVKGLLGKKPIFGICLGHQLLALALGAKTYKLKFGHRGANQPVKDLATGRVEITTQNHGFCVDVASLPKGVIPTYVHLNDGTSEGIAVPDARAFSVQFHPEAAAGPHDSLALFDQFARAMAAS
ncbi:MAG: glutamine-hydrolyzing carbamoyl-phosphate synthase small subunit [Myxococcales bacterium]|nr:glutamine-hydrolyzing carbamoyl-phosphate synthase small subunit [Myxococcales bacterium]